MSYADDMRVELTDMITDWIIENARRYTCSHCAYNEYQEDINYWTCEADQDLFVCPYINDLDGTISSAVSDIIDCLMEGPQEEIISLFE